MGSKLLRRSLEEWTQGIQIIKHNDIGGGGGEGGGEVRQEVGILPKISTPGTT